ncbi:Aquaporin NIP1-2 [Linum perenne]
MPPPPAASSSASIAFIQKMAAELVGTYLLIFAGSTVVAVNMNFEKVATLPGIGLVWGFSVMVLIYSLGHVSGAHFNPAVTLAFATCSRFPWKQVPGYIASQVAGSTLGVGTVRLIFRGKQDHFTGTLPAGSEMQSFVVEFIITFYLMFVIFSTATDHRAVSEMAGFAIGGTVLVIVIFAGPITGASMNPARSIGPAIVWSEYKSLWLYILAPILGAQAGALTCNFLKPFTSKPIIHRAITNLVSPTTLNSDAP